ncbi:MAG: hypothetical protein HZC42_10750 [Candidatus Eisenbacteria bacterium]|nr:hypothetical protein [Candidatus Eisenbacteria bacterium]
MSPGSTTPAQLRSAVSVALIAMAPFAAGRAAVAQPAQAPPPGASQPAQAAGHAHRHRLIGLAAKAVMMHGSVLYLESGPELALDRDLARQHAEEIARLVRSQIANLLAFERVPVASPEEARALAEMASVAGRVRSEADSLREAIASPGGKQAEIRRRAQRIFHLERRVLQLHQAAETALGIKPPTDPPEPAAETSGGR